MTEAKTQVSIPENVQRGIRLESIFMPRTREQRDEFRDEPSGNDPRFVHYTSAENALSIIQSKRLWMRNATCMSDYREVQHGFDILAKYFSDKSRMDAFSEALDICATGAALEAVNQFNQWWNNFNFRFDTYIASISEHDSKEDLHGRLSMWRAFGNNTARVALVIRIPWISRGADALNLMFSPVAYLTEREVHSVMNDVIKNIGMNVDFLRSLDRQIVITAVFNMLRAGVICLKHEGFREEREWRAIYSPKLTPSPLMEASAEVIGGVPQVVCKVPLDVAVSDALADLDLSRLFDRLIIGPSPYPWVMYEAFTEALKKAGVEEAGKRVFASCIPIRS